MDRILLNFPNDLCSAYACMHCFLTSVDWTVEHLNLNWTIDLDTEIAFMMSESFSFFLLVFLLMDNILLFKPLRHGTEQNARDQNPQAPLHVTVEIIPWVLADNIGHVQPEDSFWCLLADVMFSLPSVSPCEERVVVQNPQHVAFVLGTLMGFHIKRAFPPPCCVLSVQWQCTHDNLSQRNSYGTCNKAGLTEHFNCPPWGLVIPPCYPHVQLCNFNDPNFFKKKRKAFLSWGVCWSRNSIFPHSILWLFITPEAADWAHRKRSVSATGRQRKVDGLIPAM